MVLRMRLGLVGLLLLVARGSSFAQPDRVSERPARHEPVRPTTRRGLERREALTLYGLGMLHERRNKLVEAARTLEEARRLDPDSASIHKALAPIYLALDRIEDALASCRRALELDPDDHETGYLYARQLRRLDRRAEALKVLQRTTFCPGLKERPDQRAQVWFDLGVLHEQAENYKQAERCFLEVVGILDNPVPLVELGAGTREEIANQAAETCERLGRICLKAGSPTRAIAAFRQAQKKDPARAARLAYNLAQVLEGQGKHRLALTQLEEYLRTQPSETEGYELKIRLQRKLGRQADVLPQLQAASDRDPNNMDLRLLLAREYRRAGQSSAAERIYNDLLGRTDGPEVYRGLFALYRDEGPAGGRKVLARLDATVRQATGSEVGRGNPAAAASARAMLAALRGDGALVKLLLQAARSQVLAGARLGYGTRTLLGLLAARAQQLDVAEQLYRACLGPSGEVRRDMEAEVYGGLLRVLYLQHKHAAIVALCKQGLEKALQTNRVLFHEYLARAETALGNSAGALKAAEAAVKEADEPNRLRAHLLRAEVLSGAGKHEEAVAECQKLLKEYNQGGDLRDVRVLLSSVYATAGRHDQSEEQLELVLCADPNDALANNNLGYQWADRHKNLAEAEKLIRKALELDRRQRTSGTALSVDSDHDKPEYIDSLGWVLFRRGRLAEARQELERALALPGGDDDPVVWDHLGDVCFRQRESARAARAWKKALALFEAGARRKSDPRYKEIREKLRLVKP
jgi:tetratricopeptide (TPR) repeat protein